MPFLIQITYYVNITDVVKHMMTGKSEFWSSVTSNLHFTVKNIGTYVSYENVFVLLLPTYVDLVKNTCSIPWSFGSQKYNIGCLLRTCILCHLYFVNGTVFPPIDFIHTSLALLVYFILVNNCLACLLQCFRNYIITPVPELILFKGIQLNIRH